MLSIKFYSDSYMQKNPCPIGYTINTAAAATTGAEKATKIQGLIPNLKLNSYSLPIQQNTLIIKCKTIN